MVRGFPDWKGHAPQKTYEQLTREQNGFWHWARRSGVASQSTRAQLWNPVDSGVDILVHRIVVMNEFDGSVYITFKGSKLGTFGGNGYNRYVGGPSSEGEVYYESNASTILYWWGAYSCQADIDKVVDLPYLWLPPGKDLTVQNGVMDSTLTVNFLWFEMVEF